MPGVEGVVAAAASLELSGLNCQSYELQVSVNATSWSKVPWEIVEPGTTDWTSVNRIFGSRKFV